MVDPASKSLRRSNEPLKWLTDVPLQNISAGFIFAPAATSDALPPTVALDLGPPSGQPFPLSPGPAARTGEVVGTKSAADVTASTASHDSRRARRDRAPRGEYDM